MNEPHLCLSHSDVLLVKLALESYLDSLWEEMGKAYPQPHTASAMAFHDANIVLQKVHNWITENPERIKPNDTPPSRH